MGKGDRRADVGGEVVAEEGGKKKPDTPRTQRCSPTETTTLSW